MMCKYYIENVSEYLENVGHELRMQQVRFCDKKEWKC